MREQELSNKVKELAQQAGALVKVTSQDVQARGGLSGLPDLVILRPRRIYAARTKISPVAFVELKVLPQVKPNLSHVIRALRPSQRAFILECNQRCFLSHFILCALSNGGFSLTSSWEIEGPSKANDTSPLNDYSTLNSAVAEIVCGSHFEALKELCPDTHTDQ